MMNKLQRGFTLIELLVVIAIIGILAAVVLASLNDARDGGQDASIKQSIGNARSQAELYYNSTGFTYDGFCATAAATSLIEAAESNRAETGTTAVIDNNAVANEVVCNDSDAAYVLAAPLNIFGAGTEGEVAWCVDSTGIAEEIAAITDIDAGETSCAG